LNLDLILAIIEIILAFNEIILSLTVSITTLVHKPLATKIKVDNFTKIKNEFITI
jgi:hypothetical protein